MKDNRLTILIRSSIAFLILSAIAIIGVLAFTSTELVEHFADDKPILKPIKNPIEYNMDCLNDKNDIGTNPLIEFGRSIEEIALKQMNIEVSVDEEEKYGAKLYDEVKKEYTIINDSRAPRLNDLLARLVKVIPDAKGFHYSVYLIESDELNAFTAGARIFVTTRMLDFVLSDDELACVLGHEIYHNELGHINKHMQKVKLLTDGGASINKLFTIPFGQHDEGMCDLHGIDLVFAAGLDGCKNIGLWERFKSEAKEGEFNPIENLFRSHPYSASRSECSKAHIINNYGFNCSK